MLATGPEFASRLSRAKTVKEFEEILRRQGLSKWEVERILMKAIAVGAVTLVKEEMEFDLSKIEVDPSKLESEPKPKKDEIVQAPLDLQSIAYELVCTAPTRLVTEVIRAGAVLTENAFRALINATKSELVIVSPFLEREGVYALRSEFIDAAERGIGFKLLIRSINNVTTALAISDLFGIFGDKIQVKEFHTEARLYDRWRQLESTHAKLIIRDQEEMYVGSAEIRPNALYSNFEIGLRLTDKMTVAKAYKLFRLFWSDVVYSRQVTREEIREVVSKMVR